MEKPQICPIGLKHANDSSTTLSENPVVVFFLFDRLKVVMHLFQTGGHNSEDHHAGHVVCGWFPLDEGERAKGTACRSTHPHAGTPLFIL